MSNGPNKWVKRTLRTYRAFFSTCAGCGVKKNDGEKFDFAHLKETGLHTNRRHRDGRGRKERLHDIRIHPDHYTVLDKLCHDLFDSGEPLALGQPKSLLDIANEAKAVLFPSQVGQFAR